MLRIFKVLIFCSLFSGVVVAKDPGRPDPVLTIIKFANNVLPTMNVDQMEQFLNEAAAPEYKNNSEVIAFFTKCLIEYWKLAPNSHGFFLPKNTENVSEYAILGAYIQDDKLIKVEQGTVYETVLNRLPMIVSGLGEDIKMEYRMFQGVLTTEKDIRLEAAIRSYAGAELGEDVVGHALAKKFFIRVLEDLNNPKTKNRALAFLLSPETESFLKGFSEYSLLCESLGQLKAMYSETEGTSFERCFLENKLNKIKLDIAGFVNSIR